MGRRKRMRIFIYIMIFLLSLSSYSQKNRIRKPSHEHLIIQMNAGLPRANDENGGYGGNRGFNYSLEAGYSGFLEAKVGFEIFESQFGGHQDAHASVGLKIVHGFDEQYNYYLGYRISKIWRERETARLTESATVMGLEASMIFDIDKTFYWGFRYSLDNGKDREILLWDAKPVSKFFVTLGIKIHQF